VNVLLTGANGFVGSHVLDALIESGLDVSALIRTTSNTAFIGEHLGRVRLCYGAMDDPRSIVAALEGVDAVVHAAGRTKANRARAYYDVNVGGTANVVAACNRAAGRIRRLVLISSLAASGPGTTDSPRTEQARPRPVSHYGRSKLMAERCVARSSRVPYVILRPAAVYGPRDRDFLLVFEAVRRGILPLIDGGRQRLSLIYVRDLARTVVSVLTGGLGAGGVYHLAHPEPCSHREFASAVARAMRRHVAEPFVPRALLYPLCLAGQITAAVRRRTSVLNLDKVAEYSAPGWVCSTQRASDDLGFEAPTSLEEGVRQTLDWYLQEDWLPGR